MDFNAIKEWITTLFNTPLVMWGSFIGEIGTFVLVIFAKTSFGKKKIRELKELYKEAKKQADTCVVALTEYKKEKEAEIQKLVQTYEDKLSLAMDEVYKIEELLKEVADKTPNRKVRETLNSFVDGKAERMVDLARKLPTSAQIDELRSELEEKENEVLNFKEECEKAIEGINARYAEKEAQVGELLGKLNEVVQKANTEVNDG